MAALLELVALSEDFLATDGDVLRHLYVEDGFLKAQDKTAAKIETWNAEAAEALAALESKLESERAKATLAEFTGSYEEFVAASGKAIKLSRQETVDGVDERDGSRNTYADEVRPVLRASTASTTGWRTRSPSRRPPRPRRAMPRLRASGASS